MKIISLMILTFRACAARLLTCEAPHRNAGEASNPPRQTPKGDAVLSAEVGQALSFRLRVGNWGKYSSKKTSTAKLLTFQTYTR
jgi:hypothetical protein